MRVWKWKNNDIVKLLEVCERCEILWRVLCYEYAHTTQKANGFQNFNRGNEGSCISRHFIGYAGKK